MSLNSTKLLLLLFLIISCNSRNNSTIKKEPSFDGIRNNILNRKAEFLSSILQEEVPANLIFYYSGYDCGTCIDKGFEIVKKLEKSGQKVTKISSQSDIGKDQLYFNYFNRIYIDQNDYLHSTFSFIPTPFIMSIDNNLEVLDMYFIQSNNNDPDSLRFFNNQSTIRQK